MHDLDINRLSQAAADPDRRPVPVPDPDRWETRNAAAWDRVDAAMLAVLDLVPDRLSWQALALMERLIKDDGWPNEDETAANLGKVQRLIGLVPAALQAEAWQGITELMQAASQHIASINSDLCWSWRFSA